MTRSIALIALPLALGGCLATKTPEPEVRIQEVYISRPVPCVPDNLAEKPDNYPDTEAALLAAADGPERYRLVAAGRELRIARLGEVEPVIAACREAAK